MASSDKGWDRSALTQDAWDAPVGVAGAVLSGRYELSAPLGSGGMGEVWEARHLTLGKRVAVKLLRFGAMTGRARLLQEARLLATLRHDAIVEVFDFGETDSGVPYFVMERIEGGSLADALELRGPLPVGVAVAMGVALADGLGRAHAAGVIHRDVKPDNILLPSTHAEDARPHKLRPKLVDFGVAYVAREGVARLTTAGGVVGTPEYMAPEAIRGVEPRERGDVWGLAITLYEAMTGVSPFRAPDIVTAFRKVLDEPVPFPHHVAGFDRALWSILTEALSKDPAARTPSVDALGAALAAWSATHDDTADAWPTHSAPRARVGEPSRAHAIEDDAPISLDALIRAKLRG